VIAINTATVYRPFCGKLRIGYAGTPSINAASGDRALIASSSSAVAREALSWSPGLATRSADAASPMLR